MGGSKIKFIKGVCSPVEFLCELCELGLETSQIQKRPKLACACSDLLVLCMCLLMLSLCLHARPVLSPSKSSYGTVPFSCINFVLQKNACRLVRMKNSRPLLEPFVTHFPLADYYYMYLFTFCLFSCRSLSEMDNFGQTNQSKSP